MNASAGGGVTAGAVHHARTTPAAPPATTNAQQALDASCPGSTAARWRPHAPPGERGGAVAERQDAPRAGRDVEPGRKREDQQQHRERVEQDAERVAARRVGRAGRSRARRRAAARTALKSSAARAHSAACHHVSTRSAARTRPCRCGRSAGAVFGEHGGHDAAAGRVRQMRRSTTRAMPSSSGVTR